MLAGRTYSITELCQASGFDRRTIVYYIQQGLIPKAGRRGPNTRYPEEALLRLQVVRGVKAQQDQGRCGTVTLLQIRGMLGRLDAAGMRAIIERGLPPEEFEPLLAPATPATATPAAQAAAPSPTAATPPAATPPATDPSATTAAPTPPAAARPSLFTGPSASRPTVGDGRSYGLADAGIRNRAAAQAALRPPSPAPAAPPPGDPPGAPAASHSAPPPADGATAEPVEAIHASLGELLRELELRPAMGARRLAPGAAEQWTEIPITSRVYLSVRGLSEADAPLAEAVARGMKKLLRAR